MGAIDGPRLVRPDEFDEMMQLLDRSFSYASGGMAENLSFVYDRSRPERHSVIAVDGEIVGQVACVPETLDVGDGVTVPCAGIGGVTTAKPHRGNGYMSRLLEFWLDWMDEQGILLAELGGNRQRYGHFGWENGAPQVSYTLTDRSMGPMTQHGTVSNYGGTAGEIDALREVHGAVTPHFKRDRETTRVVYGQRGLETLLHREDSELTACLSLSRTRRSRTIEEIGGTETGVESLLAYLRNWWDCNDISVRLPPNHPLNDWFVDHASGWRLRPSRKINVRDLGETLRTYEPVLERRYRESSTSWTGSVTVGIEQEADTVCIDCSSTGLSVEATGGAPDVTVDRMGATRLLFGGHGRMRGVKKRYPVLDVLFPLPFHVWASERV